jgi:GTP1/Obg family GTP-binding protein
MSSKNLSTDDSEKDFEQEYVDRLRDSARGIRDDLDALAEALDDGEADADDVHEVYRALTYVLVDVEDAAHETGTIDATTPEFRAVDEARKTIYHMTAADPRSAIGSAHTAAEYAEQEAGEIDE